MEYNKNREGDGMNTIKRLQAFIVWMGGLKDMQAKQRIAARINRAMDGNFGDHHFLRDGVSEMRIDCGPGYRVYYAQEGTTIYLLLSGGDKRNQDADIAKAIALWKTYKEGEKQ